MKTPLAIVLSVVVAAGVIAATQLAAQTTAPPPASTTTPAGTPASASIATVHNIVEITRAVPAGTAAVDAFTVPAGLTLVVTDIVVTNPGAAAACGGAVNRAGAASAATTPTTAVTPTAPTVAPPPPTDITAPAAAIGPTPATVPAVTATSAGTLTQTDSTVTGPLCVPAQTTTTLPLTTGIEFASGQVVQLLNAPTAAGAPASLAFHLRGVLITLT